MSDLTGTPAPGRAKAIAFTQSIWLVLFLVVETGFRIHHYWQESRRADKITGRASIFVPHPFMNYVANPDHPEHTVQGFRGKELYSPDHDSLRIVALGGSSTYGTRVKLEDSYPYRLEQELEAALETRAEVINAGLGGYSTPSVLNLLALRLIEMNPDVAVLYVGFNDAWNRLLFSGFELDYSHAMRLWTRPRHPWWRRSMVLDRISELLGSPSARDPHVHQISWWPKSGDPEDNWSASSDRAFRNNLVSIIALCRAHGITPVLCTQATDFVNHPVDANESWKRALQEYNRVIEETAEHLDVACVDVASEMSNRPEYFADVLHMTSEGNHKRARIIASFLIDAGIVGAGEP